MLTVQVWNTSDLAPTSDYSYAVYINRDCIATGSVKGHERAKGWPALVKQIAEEHVKAEVPRVVYACAAVDSKGRVCVKPSGLHKHKYERVVPAKRGATR